MDTPTLQNRIEELKAQVEPYSNGKSFSTGFSWPVWQDKYVYLAIPIAILILLVAMRPNLIKVDLPDKKGKMNRVVSFKKLLQVWLIVSTILIVAVYGYKYKKANWSS